jgi:hypothetical protein
MRHAGLEVMFGTLNLDSEGLSDKVSLGNAGLKRKCWSKVNKFSH